MNDGGVLRASAMPDELFSHASQHHPSCEGDQIGEQSPTSNRTFLCVLEIQLHVPLSIEATTNSNDATLQIKDLQKSMAFHSGILPLKAYLPGFRTCPQSKYYHSLVSIVQSTASTLE
jgi:hypothetical protein